MHPISPATADEHAPSSVVMDELVRQLRALDEHGRYDQWTAEQLLSPYIHKQEQPRTIPLIGDPIARIKAYFNAIAAQIERQSGLLALPLVFINYQGSGRALIIVGKLVVLDRGIQDVQRFGFRNLTRMQEEAEKTLNKALALIRDHPQVASL